MDQNSRFFVVKDRVSLAKTNGGVLGVCSTHEQQHFTIIYMVDGKISCFRRILIDQTTLEHRKLKYNKK